MGLRKWWNMLLIRLGITEITPYGKCLYQYCQDIINEKDVYIQTYEDDLMEMWDYKYSREMAAANFILYMNDNYDMEEV